MTLLLTGSPTRFGEDRFTEDNGLLATVQAALPLSPRVLLVSAAPDDRKFTDYVLDSMSACIRNSGISPACVTMLDRRNAGQARDLVRNALRMRPDRIIVGECRGGESLDMLQAMNTGHDGSLTTVHANSPRDVISRLETMVLMSGMELPSKAIRDQIASAVDIIIQEARLSDGSRKVMAISEVTGMEGAQIVMQDLFVFEQTGVDERGKILGRFKPTGLIPSFFDQLSARGIHMDPRMFQS